MVKSNRQQRKENQPNEKLDAKPKKRRGRPEKVLKIEDTPLDVARAMWGERSTKFPKIEE